jgi:hypothetical protein
MTRAGRRLGGAVLLVGLLWFLGGWAGLVVGVAVAVWDRVRRPPARQLLQASLVLLALVPLAVLARGLPTSATVSPAFASGNLVAHDLAGAGVALLVLGILRDAGPAGRGTDRVGQDGATDREPAG